VVGWSVYAMLGLTEDPLARSAYVARRRAAVKFPRMRSCPLDIYSKPQKKVLSSLNDDAGDAG